jgi:hypothetical protein
MWKLGLRPQFPEKEYINGIFLAVCAHWLTHPQSIVLVVVYSLSSQYLFRIFAGDIDDVLCQAVLDTIFQTLSPERLSI